MRKELVLHDLFRIGIAIKGIDGILELIGGLILFSVDSAAFSGIVQSIFSHELATDPTNLIANYFIHLSGSTVSFAALYLVLHGLIKIGLVLGLWSNRLWAYPLAGVVLSVFIVYQLLRVLSSHSLILLLLTFVDIIILVLLRFEYQRVTRMDAKC